MPTTTLHVTIDQETKQKAEKLAQELGLDISTIVRAGLRQFVRTESFSVQKSRRMTPYLDAVIHDALATPDDVSPAFEHADDAIAYLDSAK